MIGLEKVAEVKVKLEDQLQAYQYWNQNFVAVSDKKHESRWRRAVSFENLYTTYSQSSESTWQQ